MTAAAQALGPEGILAFTVETDDGDEFSLGANLRYRHSRDYLMRALDAAALRPLTLAPASTRLEAGAPVEGFVVVATGKS